MTSSWSTELANGDHLAVAVFRCTCCFHWKVWGGGKWYFKGTVSSWRPLEKGRCCCSCSCAERTRNKNKFTRVEIVMILTAKSHPLEPLKLEKFGLHLCSVFKNQQVNLNCLALVYLRSDISQSTVAFSYREQFYFNHSWQFSRTYYLCLFFNRIVAEMLSAHWWLRTIILNVNFKDVVFFLLFFCSLYVIL